MLKTNRAMFGLGFVFFFLGDLITTAIALNNGFLESGLIRVITRTNLYIMILAKVLFFLGLYALIDKLENKDNYLCGCVLGLIVGLGMAVTWTNVLTITNDN